MGLEVPIELIRGKVQVRDRFPVAVVVEQFAQLPDLELLFGVKSGFLGESLC